MSAMAALWKRRRRRRALPAVAVLVAVSGGLYLVANLCLFVNGFYSYGSTLNHDEVSHRIANSPSPDQRTLLTGVLAEIASQLMLSRPLKSSRLRKLMENTLPRETVHAQTHKETITNKDEIAAVLYGHLKQSSNCGETNSIIDLSHIGSGWTKSVFKGVQGRHNVAVKTLNPNGRDVLTCMERDGLNHIQCQNKASLKLLKEMVLLKELTHNNIIKVKSYCMSDDEVYDGYYLTPVTLVTELGDNIDLIRLLQMSWEDRLRISLGLTQLVKYMSVSPLGSLAMNDFRRQQFVTVDGEIKLTDLDDISFGDPKCSTREQCVQFYSSTNFTIRTECINGKCDGYNERMNIFNTGRHFTTFLLPHGSPKSLRPLVDQIVEGFRNAQASASKLLALMNKLFEQYASGAYLNRAYDESDKTEYKSYNHSDLPGLFDYRCKSTIGGAACTVSVFDVREAKQICDADDQCHCFVISQQRTWTGRMVAHFKNSFSKPSKSENKTLYVKALKYRHIAEA